MGTRFNPFTNNLDYDGTGGFGTNIPQLDSDPASPTQETAWILRTFTGGGAGSGEAYGLLLTLTQPGDGATTAYQLSYRTKEDTTVRVSLT